MTRYLDDIGVPYPPVFRDWAHRERRVATAQGISGGIRVEMLMPDGTRAWLAVELAEEDATLLAASLLQRAGHRKLAKRAVKAAQP